MPNAKMNKKAKESIGPNTLPSGSSFELRISEQLKTNALKKITKQE